MIYEEDIIDLLGADVYKTFLEAVDNGEISEVQMADIAFKLHKRVGGDFRRACESKAFKYDRAAARTVLDNWYSYDLAEGQTDKLVRILQSDNIALKALAERVKTQQNICANAKAKAKEVLDGEDKLFAEMFPFGNFSKKDICGITFSVFRAVSTISDDQFTAKEWENMRKSLDHKHIVKFHHSYKEEGSSIRCFVLEPLEIAYGTLANVAQQRTDDLREFNIWRFLSTFSSALTHLHQQQSTTRPVLAYDLSPHTVIDVYETEELKKAGLYTWKLLLLGSNTEQSLALSEVFFSFVSNQLITFL